LFGTTPATNTNQQALPKLNTPSTLQLIKAYLNENGDRWCVREFTRINSVLGFLPKEFITKQKAIDLKASILKVKTATTFNRYLKYFNAFYRWFLANNAQITVNPFDGLRITEKKFQLLASVMLILLSN